MKQEELFDTIESLFHEYLVEFESRVRKLSDTEKGIAKSLFISGIYRGIQLSNGGVEWKLNHQEPSSEEAFSMGYDLALSVHGIEEPEWWDHDEDCNCSDCLEEDEEMKL